MLILAGKWSVVLGQYHVSAWLTYVNGVPCICPHPQQSWSEYLLTAKLVCKSFSFHHFEVGVYYCMSIVKKKLRFIRCCTSSPVTTGLLFYSINAPVLFSSPDTL